MPGMGEGRGVRSDMPARYGDGIFEPGDTEEVMLEDDNADRRDEPRAGKVEIGEVMDCCSFDSEGDDVSYIEGVSSNRGPLLDEGDSTFVLICRPEVFGMDWRGRCVIV